jgi:hypothetical protein
VLVVASIVGVIVCRKVRRQQHMAKPVSGSIAAGDPEAGDDPFMPPRLPAGPMSASPFRRRGGYCDVPSPSRVLPHQACYKAAATGTPDSSPKKADVENDMETTPWRPTSSGPLHSLPANSTGSPVAVMLGSPMSSRGSDSTRLHAYSNPMYSNSLLDERVQAALPWDTGCGTPTGAASFPLARHTGWSSSPGQLQPGAASPAARAAHAGSAPLPHQPSQLPSPQHHVHGALYSFPDAGSPHSAGAAPSRTSSPSAHGALEGQVCPRPDDVAAAAAAAAAAWGSHQRPIRSGQPPRAPVLGWQAALQSPPSIILPEEQQWPASPQHSSPQHRPGPAGSGPLPRQPSGGKW